MPNPVGSGKTLIAVLLLKYMLDRELEDRALGKKPRIAFFLVGTAQYAISVSPADPIIGRLCDFGLSAICSP